MWQDPGATPGALITSICNLQVLFLYTNLERWCGDMP